MAERVRPAVRTNAGPWGRGGRNRGIGSGAGTGIPRSPPLSIKETPLSQRTQIIPAGLAKGAMGPEHSARGRLCTRGLSWRSSFRVPASHSSKTYGPDPRGNREVKKAGKFLYDAGALAWPILLPRWGEGGPQGAQPRLEIQFG